ncbi:MAG: hypothetical protein ACK452_10780 [Bacteroidota bacterium]
MKKIIATVFVLSLFAVSCKKDRVCECTSTSNSGGGTTVYKVTYFDARKSDARKLCTFEAIQVDEVSPTSAVGDKTTCELK